MTSMMETTIEVTMEKIPRGFSLVDRILGEKDENIGYIKKETGASIQHLVKGQHRNTVVMVIRHQDIQRLKTTENLIQSLITTIKEDYADFLEEQPPFIRGRYKLEDLKTTQVYTCRPRCNLNFEDIQTYQHHLTTQWHLMNVRKNDASLIKGPAPGEGETKDFVGTVTDVKGAMCVISDSILYDLRKHPTVLHLKVGDRVKGVQVPSTHPSYKWKALTLEPLQKGVVSGLVAAELPSPRHLDLRVDDGLDIRMRTVLQEDDYAPTEITSSRANFFEKQMLRAFSFYLNEQTTPRALWNTHHIVQSQSRNRIIQRPPRPQSATYCMLCNARVEPAAMMTEHLKSIEHRNNYVEKQLELGLEKFPQIYGLVPLPGVNTNNGKRLAVEALSNVFGTDLPNHNSDAFKSMILLNGAVKNRYCEICKVSYDHYDSWIHHVTGKRHALKCVELMANKGLHFYLQRNPNVPAPSPKKMKGIVDHSSL